MEENHDVDIKEIHSHASYKLLLEKSMSKNRMLEKILYSIEEQYIQAEEKRRLLKE